MQNLNFLGIGNDTFIHTGYIFSINCNQDAGVCNIRTANGGTHRISKENSPGIYQDVKRYYDSIESAQYDCLYKNDDNQKEKDRKNSIFRNLCLD